MPGPEAADELWHLMTTMLITGRSPSATAQTLKSVVGTPAKPAAQFWLDRLSRPEPPEVDRTAQRTAKVVAFETAIKETLASVATSETAL